METLILIEQYFILFAVYAVGGWIIEEIHCSIKEKRIVDRGFLIGPVCPIYGFGGLLITILLTPFIDHPVTLFCMGIIVCAVLEYFTSFLMEKIFNARWWDYSNEKLNLNGRICIRTLIPFGIFGVIVVYILNPIIFKLIESMPIVETHSIAWTTATIMMIDLAISMYTVSKVTSTAKRIIKENPKDNTNEITIQVKNILRETFTGKRLVDAYPDFVAFGEKIKKIVEDAENKSKEAVEKVAKKSKRVAKKATIKTKQVMKKAKNSVKKKE